MHDASTQQQIGIDLKHPTLKIVTAQMKRYVHWQYYSFQGTSYYGKGGRNFEILHFPVKVSRIT